MYTQVGVHERLSIQGQLTWAGQEYNCSAPPHMLIRRVPYPFIQCGQSTNDTRSYIGPSPVNTDQVLYVYVSVPPVTINLQLS